MPTQQSPNGPRSSRRQFLQRSAVVAAAGSTHALARGAHAAGDDAMRLGLIGCGGRGAGAVADALTADPGARLVAMADLFADRAREIRQVLKEQFSDRITVDDAHTFVGLDAYRNVIDSADVVLIACAAKFHPLYLLAAIEAGKHVFVEKPHAIDPYGIQSVRRACDLAREKKLSVLSGLQSRFHPAIRETIERVRDGQIGRVISIEENFIRSPYGNVRRPPEWRELEVQYGNQYRFSWLCGDDVTQSLVHNLDRANNPYVAEHRALFRALRDGTPLNCGDYMARSTLVAVMGQLSCYSGRQITWDAIEQSAYHLPVKPEECTWEMKPPTLPDADGRYPACAIPGVTKNV